jgi:hypothetical protein
LAVEFGRTFFSRFDSDNVFSPQSRFWHCGFALFSAVERKAEFRKLAFGQKFDCGFAISARRYVQTIAGRCFAGNISFLPMTLLIVTAMLSCYIQFYGFLKLRLAK